MHLSWTVAHADERGVAHSDERGVAFVATLFAAAALGAMVYATSILAGTELGDSRRSILDVKAFTLADAGAERGVWFVRDAVKKTAPLDPLLGLQTVFADGQGGLKEIKPYQAEPVWDGTNKLGEFTVSLSAVQRNDGLDITITSTGYFPAAPQSLPAGSPPPQSETIRTTVRVELQPSQIFDYAYFINNWGWFYGNTIFCNGNLRSNGQFDAGGYAPTITGQATYDSLAWAGPNADLTGYQDTNNDTLHDGLDGGIFSGWDIVNVQNVQGEGGKAKNQHDFQDTVPMPNLNNLKVYEDKAISGGGNIKIGTTVVCDGVCGDGATEKQNLYLIGTAANPIEITGTVVVRGNVIIAGVVKGQGSIYAGGNVYIPNNLTYANAPATARPAGVDEASQEAWIAANKDKDLLGLFARENIVLGNHTNNTWRYYVDWWMSHADNRSDEDAGEDGIPNTKVGKDGQSGTLDDDVLEDDQVWTTEKYTDADAAAGLIPAGKNVGDPIPGTGEDIDGDGVQDGSIGLAELDLSVALDTTNWAGNMPAAGVASYSTISSMAMTKVEAVMYTNHAFAWVTIPNAPIAINGSIVARNESIVYGAPSITMNYDCRLLGGASSVAKSVCELPRGMSPITTISWSVLSYDPNQVVSN